MVRKSKRRSPGFILTPAAPLELARKGMETVEADLTARLSRQRNEDAKSAGLMKKLAQAQLDVLSKSGVDVGALAREVRQLRRQRAPKQAFPELLQSKVSAGLAVPGYSLVTPPYSWGWSPPGNYVDYAPSPPATLSNYADPETGTLGFDERLWLWIPSEHQQCSGRSGHLLQARAFRTIVCPIERRHK